MFVVLCVGFVQSRVVSLQFVVYVIIIVCSNKPTRVCVVLIAAERWDRHGYQPSLSSWPSSPCSIFAFLVFCSCFLCLLELQVPQQALHSDIVTMCLTLRSWQPLYTLCTSKARDVPSCTLYTIVIHELLADLDFVCLRSETMMCLRGF